MTTKFSEITESFSKLTEMTPDTVIARKISKVTRLTEYLLKEYLGAMLHDIIVIYYLQTCSFFDIYTLMISRITLARDFCNNHFFGLEIQRTLCTLP